MKEQNFMNKLLLISMVLSILLAVYIGVWTEIRLKYNLLSFFAGTAGIFIIRYAYELALIFNYSLSKLYRQNSYQDDEEPSSILMTLVYMIGLGLACAQPVLLICF